MDESFIFLPVTKNKGEFDLIDSRCFSNVFSNIICILIIKKSECFFFSSSIFISTNCQCGLNKLDNMLFILSHVRAAWLQWEMKQCLYNNTFIIHMFHFEVASSLIWANYGCNTLETGWRKHAWREERSLKDTQNNHWGGVIYSELA